MARAIPKAVLDAGRADYQCVLRRGARLLPIMYRGRVVGFYSPHMTPMGRRIGPLFVLPEYRRLGLAFRAYTSVRGPLVACVRDDNRASVALHRSAGFRRWRRYASEWWWRRP